MWIIILIIIIVIIVVGILLMERRTIASITPEHTRFETLFHSIDGFQISKKAREKAHINSPTFVYGEITFKTLQQLLALAEPEADDIFYDCGCGVGKAVIGAALLYPLKRAIGIELLPELLEAASTVCQRYDGQTPVEFLQGDLLEIDWSDGDIVFLNATCFFGEELEKLIAKCQQLKSGARLLITSKTLPLDTFEIIDQGQYAMSWGEATVTTYKKR